MIERSGADNGWEARRKAGAFKAFLTERRRRIIIHAVFLLAAALMSFYYAHTRGQLTRQNPDVTMRKLIEGQAGTPFQYRYLTPWLMKKTMVLTWRTPIEKIINGANIVLWFESMSVFILLVSFRYYLSFFIKGTEASSVLAFTVLVPMASNYMLARMVSLPDAQGYFQPLYFPYDTPSVMFFTIGLILIYKRKWPLYYLLFALATFNRETSCFLTMVYALVAYGRDRAPRIAAHVAAQTAIWVSIKLYLKLLFAANPGAPFDLTLHASLIYYQKFYHYPQLLSNLAGIWLLVAIFYGRLEDRFLRRSVIVAIPFYLGMMMVGNLYELRVFGELAPVLTPAAIMIIKSLLSDENAAEAV